MEYTKESLVEDVKSLLGNDFIENTDRAVEIFVNRAIQAVFHKRYTSIDMTEDILAKIVSEYYGTILDIAVYLYDKQGAEGEKQHSENGTDRTYESGGIPGSMLVDVVNIPFII